MTICFYQKLNVFCTLILNTVRTKENERTGMLTSLTPVPVLWYTIPNTIPVLWYTIPNTIPVLWHTIPNTIPVLWHTIPSCGVQPAILTWSFGHNNLFASDSMFQAF